MIKIIKKNVVIEALKKEKLTTGMFFSSYYMSKVPKDCKVCAVGAVLRHVSFETWARKNSYSLNALGQAATQEEYTGDNIECLIRDKNYLGALSNYFENGNSKNKCIKFVKKYFPKQFKLEINL